MGDTHSYSVAPSMFYRGSGSATILLLSGCLVLISFAFSGRGFGEKASSARKISHSYLGQDVPQTWPINNLQPVLMSVENTQRYALDTPSGDSDWAALMPPNDGIIHLGPNHRPFTISLFHQLHCLDIIRVAIVAKSTPGNRGPGGLERHCMNYLREMVLCRSDLRLENVRNTRLHVVQPTSTHTCRDWERVYQEAAKNQEDQHDWA